MKRINTKGFTLLELIVAITIMALIGGTITSLLVFGYNVYGRANRDYQAQSDLKLALEEINSLVRYSKAMFAVPDADFRDKEWNYIALNDDNTAIVKYTWDSNQNDHIMTSMIGPYEGVTFDIVFYKENSMDKDNTIKVYFEMNHSDGTTQRFNIQTGYEALNSLQVVDYGTESHPARALAYRTDDFHYENNKLKVNITLVLDTSGSMSTLLGSSSRIAVLKERTKSLINAFSLNTNDDVEINIALIPFSNNANNVKVFRNVKTEKSDLEEDIDSLTANGGTNIGDGLRRAYFHLLDKSTSQINNANPNEEYIIKNYNILLTDGVATYHTLRRTCTSSFFGICFRYSYQFYLDGGSVNSNIVLGGTGNEPSPGTVIDYTLEPLSDDNLEYIRQVGLKYKSDLPLIGYIAEDKRITSYIIGFAGVDTAQISFIAEKTDTIPERVFDATDENSLELSFTNIQLSITNDTWHYLGPKLVE